MSRLSRIACQVHLEDHGGARGHALSCLCAFYGGGRVARVVASGIGRFNFASANLPSGRLDESWPGLAGGKAVSCTSLPIARGPVRSRIGDTLGYPLTLVAGTDLDFWIL